MNKHLIPKLSNNFLSITVKYKPSNMVHTQEKILQHFGTWNWICWYHQGYLESTLVQPPLVRAVSLSSPFTFTNPAKQPLNSWLKLGKRCCLTQVLSLRFACLLPVVQMHMYTVTIALCKKCIPKDRFVFSLYT